MHSHEMSITGNFNVSVAYKIFCDCKVLMRSIDRPLTLTGDGVSALLPTHVANYRPAPVTSIEPFQKEAKMVLKVHHNHGQIRQPGAKQTFSLLRELKMAQIPGYNCALSVLGWPEQTPRDEKIITLGPRCAREIQSCAKMSDFHSIFRD